jgi:mRNA-degrading endonuclease RelE of RelBE toxin-antitoxin system
VSGWEVRLSPSAQRELRRLDDGPKQAALSAIQELTVEGPALGEAIELSAIPGTSRIRFYGGYRMIFEVLKERRIRVTRISPRGIAYVGLRR